MCFTQQECGASQRESWFVLVPVLLLSNTKWSRRATALIPASSLSALKAKTTFAVHVWQVFRALRRALKSRGVLIEARRNCAILTFLEGYDAEEGGGDERHERISIKTGKLAERHAFFHSVFGKHPN